MSFDNSEVTVVGGGLAGVEATLALTRFGIRVRLFEMKPGRFSPAHQSGDLAELVCSNSLKSQGLTQATGLLQEEMERFGSIIIKAAKANSVPAGQALAVERAGFSRFVTAACEAEPLLTIVREEVTELPQDRHSIIATGPLSSEGASALLAGLTGSEHLYFYDAMAPIIDGDSIDRDTAFFASRYGKGGDDYLNCPFTKAEFQVFFEALTTARTVPTREFEEEKVFQACQPIEVIAKTGDKTLRFGPMKPVGLTDPRNGERPYAVVQLRREDADGARWNLVGFQTKLAHPEQERVFRLIPGLQNATFHRLGNLHRNTYINSPNLLDPYLRFRKYPWIQVAGQLTGVEGYLESAAMGIWAGLNLALRLTGRTPPPPPPETAFGALVNHVSAGGGKTFEPMNMNFGMLPPLGVNMRDKAESKRLRSERALEALARWKELF